MLIGMRNAMMAGKRLPYDAEVEYLESTGTQWIDTDFHAVGGNIQHYRARFSDYGKTVVLSIDRSKTSPSNDYDRNMVSPSRDSGSGYTSCASFQKCSFFASTSIPDSIFPYTWDFSRSYEIYFDTIGANLIGKIDGTTIVDTTTSGRQTGVNSVKIFRSDYSGTINSGRIYWLKLYDANGVLVRDLTPVRRTLDGVSVGEMYDRVTGMFMERHGTFVIGADKARGASAANGGGV